MTKRGIWFFSRHADCIQLLVFVVPKLASMPNFDLVYINLDSATDRKIAFEKSFGSAGFSSRWTLHRLAAVNSQSDLVKNQIGQLSGAYKGNYFSHISCVGHFAATANHLYVSEDDQRFSPETGRILEQIIDQLPPDSWDLLFPEITLLSAASYPAFYKMATSEKGKDKVRLLSLNEFPYAYVGSSGYVVNARSKRKYLQELAPPQQMDNPFDICLRATLKLGRLRGLLTFPFLTCPSPHAHESTAPYGAAANADSSEEMKRVWQYQLDMLWLMKSFVWIGADGNDGDANAQVEFAELFQLQDKDRRFFRMLSQMMVLQRNIDYGDSDIFRFVPSEVAVTRSV